MKAIIDELDKIMKDKKERRAITLSLFFLGAGIMIMIVVNGIFGIKGDAAFIALILLPFMAYLIVSGKISEFKGPGGIEAKFTQIAAEPIAVVSEKITPYIQEMQLIAKGRIKILEQTKQEIDESRPIVMTMTLKATDKNYTVGAAENYLKELSTFRNFKLIAFLDTDGKFVAYMSIRDFQSLLKNEVLGFNLLSVINSGDSSLLFQFPNIIKNAMTAESTNLEALKEMTRLKLEALIVIDEDKKLKGIVERGQILNQMILSLFNK